MKKIKLLKTIVTPIIASTMIMILLVGCGSKTSANTDKTASADTANTQNNDTGNQKGGKSFDPAQMKQKMQDGISELVKAGTINQTQGDKILAELTANGGFGGGKQGQQNNKKDSSNNNQEKNNDKNKQKGQNGQGQRNNVLSKLVQDGTITQAQADVVMTKIRGNGQRQNNNDSSNTDTSNTTNE